MAEDYRFVFSVLGRYTARLKGNESHVTVNLAAGHGQHLVYCGTLTMSEGEWAAFHSALLEALGDRVAVEDPGAPAPGEAARAIV